MSNLNEAMNREFGNGVISSGPSASSQLQEAMGREMGDRTIRFSEQEIADLSRAEEIARLQRAGAQMEANVVKPQNTVKPSTSSKPQVNVFNRNKGALPTSANVPSAMSNADAAGFFANKHATENVVDATMKKSPFKLAQDFTEARLGGEIKMPKSKATEKAAGKAFQNAKKFGKMGATFAVGAAVTGTIVSNMSRQKGRQSNAQLYGQQTPYA